MNLFTDSYQSIEENGFAELRERGSRFLAYAFHCEDEETFKLKLAELRKEHFQAVHHCSALILGADSSFQKFSDDREPSNSAGRPILRALQSAGLTYSAIIVVRYFGGKLLGVPGLISAYNGSAEMAIKQATIKEKIIGAYYELRGAPSYENDIFRIIRQVDGVIHKHSYDNAVSVIFEIRRSNEHKLTSILIEHPSLDCKHATI